MLHNVQTVPFQYSTRTTRSAETVLEEVAARDFAGIGVDERGPSYLVLRTARRYRWGADAAVVVGIAIALVALALASVNVMFILLLFLAPVMAVPLYLEHRPMLAVSAVAEEDQPTTRVTVHGQATPELAAALDAYLGTLPGAPAPAPPAGVSAG